MFLTEIVTFLRSTRNKTMPALNNTPNWSSQYENDVDNLEEKYPNQQIFQQEIRQPSETHQQKPNQVKLQKSLQDTPKQEKLKQEILKYKKPQQEKDQSKKSQKEKPKPLKSQQIKIQPKKTQPENCESKKPKPLKSNLTKPLTYLPLLPPSDFTSCSLPRIKCSSRAAKPAIQPAETIASRYRMISNGARIRNLPELRNKHSEINPIHSSNSYPNPSSNSRKLGNPKPSNYASFV